MSSSIDSLSALANLIEEVDVAVTNIAFQPMFSEERLEDLKESINLLQVQCPNHKGVIQARMTWYEAVLRRVEHDEVELAEAGGLLKMVPSPLMRTVDHFLRRSYLKGGFSHYYERVITLYERLIIATLLLQPETSSFFEKEKHRLKYAMLDGRL
jgi:hypothetical protein